MELARIFAAMVKEEASDLFLKVGVPPAMRVVGRVVSMSAPPLTEENMMEIYNEVCDDFAKKKFAEKGEVDVSYEIYGVGRFRANVFRQRGYIGMVFRHIHSKIPTLEELNLPAEALRRLALLPRGLILVTGTAGSGKSTTIAAMIDYINQTEERHIITIEDPIEFTFTDKKCVIEQREIGQDTDSFVSALKHAVRQSPDVLFIGEMRDLETMEAAIHAAETGHLVFSTLHSLNAMQTVDRIINFFPPHQHAFLQLQLSMLLQGVISQRLLPTKDGAARMPAVELMTSTPTIQELLLHGKTRELYKALKDGSYYGCMTFNQSLKSLLERDLITLEDALSAADSPDELKLELRGISKDAQRHFGGGGGGFGRR
ncbi:MAG TPA: type IV pilus twitching motility protein PilT [Planctomycetota bacterium]|jgi:twitching motility protein PilT|nr:type IV pilus twitching motility protein PilT [Planctomycetota bacterium]